MKNFCATRTDIIVIAGDLIKINYSALDIIVGLCTFVIVSDFVDFLTFLKFAFRELRHYIIVLLKRDRTQSNVNTVMISYMFSFHI